MKRYRVRGASQDWDDNGPDLLRTKVNAETAVRSKMHQLIEGWHVREEAAKDWGEWKGPLNKHDALAKLGNWSPDKKELAFHLGRKVKEKVEPTIILKYELVNDLNISCNERTEIIWSLVKAQFDHAQMAGGFVCKEYNGVPGSGWSDHAWRDAVDATPDNNNDLTDWSRRMAQSNNMEFAYLLGSQGGRVGMSAAPDYGWDWGGPSSHEWHVHYSVVDHDGRNPGC